MKPYYEDELVTLYHGDCRDVLADMPAYSVDAVVCDPPYGISFMGRQWDQPGQFGSQRSKGAGDSMSREGKYDHRTTRERGGAMVAGEYDRSLCAMRNFQSWCELWATECLRVLKPGGHMLAFGGTRTWHRLASAIEDAGFEIRDSIAWLYGSGFPKSLDVSKAIDKAAGAEREVVGPKITPDGKSYLGRRPRNADKDGWDRPWKNDDEARTAQMMATAPTTDAAKQWQGWGTALKPAFEPIVVARKPIQGTVAANVQEYGTGALNIDATRIGGQPRSGLKADGSRSQKCSDGWDRPWKHDDELASRPQEIPTGRWPSNVVLDGDMADELDQQTGTLTSGKVAKGGFTGPYKAEVYGKYQRNEIREETVYGDSGGASRFFPTFRYTAKAATAERPTADGISHPTVKPLELMRWLVRLVTPPGGVVLDPFAGSGTVGEAAIHEHKHAVLIEREPTYLPLIVARLSKPMAVGFDFEAGA